MAGLGDPLNYIKTEEYFTEAREWSGPSKIASINRTPPTSVKVPDGWRAVNILFDNGNWAVIQFIRPTLFRVRYDPTVTDPNQYEDTSRYVV